MRSEDSTRRRSRHVHCLMVFLLVAGCGRKEPPPKSDESPSDAAVTVESTTVPKESIKTFFDDPRTRIDYERLCSVATSESLVATVEASSSTYELDEDIQMTLVLRNAGKMPVMVSATSIPVEQCLFSAIHMDSGRRRIFLSLTGAVSRFMTRVVIGPGMTFEQEISLPAGELVRNPVRREMQPGRYSLVVEYSLGIQDDGVESEILDGREVAVPAGLVRAPAIEIEINE